MIIALDFDGVIVDSEMTSCKAWNLAVGDAARITIGDIMGRSVEANATQYAAIAGLGVPELIARKRAIEVSLLDDGIYPLVPGLREFIMQFREWTTLDVVSSNDREVVERHLERYGLRNRVGFVIAPATREEMKPSPVLYARLCKIRKVAPGEVIAVEDSKSGLLSARAASVAALYLNRHGIDLGDCHAGSFASFDEMAAHLRSLAAGSAQREGSDTWSRSS